MVQGSEVRPKVRSDIVGAAARLLREQGIAAMTTRGVAQAAGVQAPTLYRLFGDKDGLIDAVAEHVMATYVTSQSDTGADASDDPVESLRSGWRAHIEFGLANPELYAILSTPGRSQRSPATAMGIDVLRTLIRRLAAAGLLRVDEPRALAMIHAAGTGTVLALLGVPADERDLGLSDAMFDAVLTATSRPPRRQPTPLSAPSRSPSQPWCPTSRHSPTPNARSWPSGSPDQLLTSKTRSREHSPGAVRKSIPRARRAKADPVPHSESSSCRPLGRQPKSRTLDINPSVIVGRHDHPCPSDQ